MNSATGDGGESLTVQQLLRQLAPDYRQRFALPERHRHVLKKIVGCRSPAMGGQLFQCPACPGFHYRYHSCNDRHCPQCGQTDADDWLKRQQPRLLLPVPYFLLTFTVPEALRSFIRSHQQLALDLLFACSSQAVQELARNPRRLGADLGMLGVLHTWSRTLIYHPHIHYLVPGGGLSADGRAWIAANPKFLLPVKPLGAHFRTLFQTKLRKKHPAFFALVPPEAWQRPWIVDSRPAGSGENALRYLSRYVFKTATGNRVLPRLPDGRLRWTYRESKTGKLAAIALEPQEFVRRFLQHILPRGFARVRTFGWLHPAAKVRGNRVRALLRQHPVLTASEKQTWEPPPDPTAPETDLPKTNPQASVPLCPRCQKAMRLVGSWHPTQPLLYPKRPP
jgi:putative transposase/transposase-like zinc-binding protein